ncbi:MAG: hypothetical protein J6U54_11020 [Clostridiales bacterium]|nr:hypothetical protein [Clostridiales bacterium]
MKINWTKESVFSDPDAEYAKGYLKTAEKYMNDRLKNDGYLFLNEVLQSLGVPIIKEGQLNGWIWDRDDPNGQIPVKFKIKVDNGDVIINLNEEKDIIDEIF